MTEALSDIGVFGLGVMGSALALNLSVHDFKISVYNRNEGNEVGTVDRFISANSHLSNLTGFIDLESFIKSIRRPRKIIVMVSASAVDTVIETLLPILEEDDIILDTGNSNYLKSAKRIKVCENNGIQFLGVGVSGGEQGARFGPSIMPGGKIEAFKEVESYLNAISAKDDNEQPCMTYIGPEGAGHFVKMVHNGIEYVEMQLLAEIYQLLRKQYSYDEISSLLTDWNSGPLKSYLLEISSKILLKKEGEDYLLDQILDKAGNKGTGSWGTIAALELGSENSMMSAAVFGRYLSSMKDTRNKISSSTTKSETSELDITSLRSAYDAARKINHLQGFELMRLASLEFNWKLNFSEIARIWTNGCIIRSALMENLKERFKSTDSLFDDASFIGDLSKHESSLSNIIKIAADSRVSIPAFSAAWNYWIGLTTENGPANLIQAQRDFFGAHTYQRIDDSTGAFYHTNWEE